MAETNTTVQSSLPPVKKNFLKERYALNIKGASVEGSSLLIIYAMSYFVIKSFHDTIEKNITMKSA